MVVEILTEVEEVLITIEVKEEEEEDLVMVEEMNSEEVMIVIVVETVEEIDFVIVVMIVEVEDLEKEVGIDPDPEISPDLVLLHHELLVQDPDLKEPRELLCSGLV